MAKKKSNTAVDKIDMANCYRMLIDMEFFDEKDGPDHILDQVEEEVRQFATYRLEMLLGERDNKGPIQIESASSPFSPEEIKILKLLVKSAAKSLSEGAEVEESDIDQTELKQVLKEEPEQEEEPAPVRTSRRRRRGRSDKNSESSAITQAPASKPYDTVEQVLEAQKSPEKYQRATAKHRPAPMPTQAEIDSLNAAQAHEYAGAFDNTFQGSINRLLKE